jgi:hypothetical protein
MTEARLVECRKSHSGWNFLRPVQGTGDEGRAEFPSGPKRARTRACEDPMMELAGYVLICSVAAWIAEEVAAPGA